LFDYFFRYPSPTNLSNQNFKRTDSKGLVFAFKISPKMRICDFLVLIRYFVTFMMDELSFLELQKLQMHYSMPLQIWEELI